MASSSVTPIRRDPSANQIATIANNEMTRLYRVKAILDLSILACAEETVGDENIVLWPALEQASEMILAAINALEPITAPWQLSQLAEADHV
jgi:hypothetical protein